MQPTRPNNTGIKEAEWCSSCKCWKILASKAKCQSCLDYHREYDKNRKERLLELGICTYCGKEESLPNSVRCEKCWLKVIANAHKLGIDKWKALKDMLEYQNYTCPYTGDKLILGLNTQLDHIKSQSKYPELKTDLKNLEWVSERINKMKNNMEKEEFINFCKKVVNRLG